MRLAACERLALDGDAVVLHGGELGGRAYCVVGFGGDPHAVILADPVTREQSGRSARHLLSTFVD